jgi:hypothetical protein
MNIIERIKRFFRRHAEGTKDPRAERVDAMVRAHEVDKRA